MKHLTQLSNALVIGIKIRELGNDLQSVSGGVRTCGLNHWPDPQQISRYTESPQTRRFGMDVRGHQSRRKLLKICDSLRDPQLSRRVKAVVLALDGFTLREIAAELGCSSTSVLHWVHTYNEHGVEELLSDKPTGRPRDEPIDIELRIQLMNRQDEKDRPLSIQDIRDVIAEVTGRSVSQSRAYAILRESGIAPPSVLAARYRSR